MKTDQDKYFGAIGMKLIEYRMKTGYITAESFVLAYGLAPSSYYKAESGNPICLKNLIRYCDIFDVPVSEFLSNVKQPLITPP